MFFVSLGQKRTSFSLMTADMRYNILIAKQEVHSTTPGEEGGSFLLRHYGIEI